MESTMSQVHRTGPPPDEDALRSLAARAGVVTLVILLLAFVLGLIAQTAGGSAPDAQLIRDAIEQRGLPLHGLH